MRVPRGDEPVGQGFGPSSARQGWYEQQGGGHGNGAAHGELPWIRLKDPRITVDSRRVAITPGMAATAEIKTDRRRIISYLLSPLARRVKEGGGRER